MASGSRSARILGPRKTVEDALAVTEQSGSRLKKDLGRLDIIIVGIGVMVGAGIFVLTGQGRRDRGRARGDALVRARGRRVRTVRALLRRARRDGAGRGQRLHVLLRHPRAAARLHHRLGSGARVHRRFGGRRGRRRRLHRLDPRPGIRGQPADLDLRPAGGGWRHQPAGGAADRRARRPALPRRAHHREGEHRARRGDAARAGGRDRDRRVQRRHRQLGSVHALRRRWDRRRGGAGLLRLHRPSTSSPRPPRRRATLSATCRRASSARWRS